MIAISEAFRNSADNQISLKPILANTSMHRLTFDKYLTSAIDDGLIEKDIIDRYKVTDEGIEYLMSHGIIDV